MSSLKPMNGGKVSSRELRRRLHGEASALEEGVIPTVQALVNKDRVTQKVLVDLTAASQERWELTGQTTKRIWDALYGFQGRGFWSRLNWLVTGR